MDNSKVNLEKITEIKPLQDSTDENRNITTNSENMTFLDKLKYLKSNITVEPAIALFVIPCVTNIITTQNLNLEKACRVNLKYGDDICDDLTMRKTADHKFEEDEVQKLMAEAQAWRSLLHTIVPTIIMLFVGAWSDKAGRRKICMLVAIIGDIMGTITNVLNTHFFTFAGVRMTALLEVLFPALTGGLYVLMMAVFSYIGDITSKESRTYRIGVVSLCMSAGFPVALALGGVLRKLGYYGLFSISLSMQIMNLFYVSFYIKDRVPLVPVNKVVRSGCTGFIIEFFDIKNLRNTVATVFKNGPNKRRVKICLIFIVICLTFGPMMGENNMIYIFTRYRFNWNEVQHSIFSVFSFVTHSFGTIFAVSVFSKKLGFDDAMLGIIFAVSKILGSIIMAFARNDFEAYLPPLVEIFNGSPHIALKSIGSKMVASDEYGKLFSVIAVAETMTPVVFIPLYSKVYTLTLKVLPGAIFLITAAVTVPSLIIFTWFYRQHKKDARERQAEERVQTETAADQEKTTLIDQQTRILDDSVFVDDEKTGTDKTGSLLVVG